MYDGSPCEGNSTDYQECNTDPCPVDGRWQEWEEWAECDLTCGGGMKWRSRICIGPFHGGQDCWGEKHSFSPCNEDSCPVDGVLTEWQEWEGCSVTCGGGMQRRQRTCIPPKYGGAMCIGDLIEIRSCNNDPCPVSGFWYEWNEWSECNVTCNGGKQVRERICEPPKYDGLDCEGDDTDYKICNTNPCPIPGIWLEWTPWSSCTKTCGGGSRTRSRECDENAYGDLTVPCEGDSTEVSVCHDFDCLPYAGTCSEWAARGLHVDTEVDVEPDPNLRPAKVYCDMQSQDGIGVTVIKHTHKNQTDVTGFEGAGIYKMVIDYTIPFDTAVAIVDRSTDCEQYLKWECKAAIIHNPYEPENWSTYWENRNKTNPYYFPGATPGGGKCACGETHSCANVTLKCNCDLNDDVWRFDDGVIREKEQLPVYSFRAGDTGEKEESGAYTIGTLYCSG